MNKLVRQRAIQKELENIKKQLITKYKPERIILFGSAARGEITPDSDIDLLVIKKKVPKDSFLRKYQLYKLIDYHIGTDFIVYTPEEFKRWLKLGDPFLKLIVKEGKVLYG